jgi:DNA mismatch endonuclease, patch repair protein
MQGWSREKQLQFPKSWNKVVKILRRQKSMLGRKQSKHQKQRAHETALGNKRTLGKHWKWSKKARARIVGKPGTNTGRHFSDEHKARLRASNLGQKRSEETKAKIRVARSKQVIPLQDTLPERLIQMELVRRKIKFQKHKRLPGLPDIFLKPNICVFVDGDYWHRRPEAKIRDKKTNKTLRSKGYIVIRFWEKDIKASAVKCVDRIIKSL